MIGCSIAILLRSLAVECCWALPTIVKSPTRQWQLYSRFRQPRQDRFIALTDAAALLADAMAAVEMNRVSEGYTGLPWPHHDRCVALTDDAALFADAGAAELMNLVYEGYSKPISTT